MSDVLNRIKKRRCYPVEVGGGTVHVRSLTRGELDRMTALEKDAKTDFVLGCVLVSSAGEPEFVPEEGESDVDFAKRIKAAVLDVDTETIAAITEAVGKIGKVTATEALEKK